jgi:HPt (histidine-containing phosphotransfer) domain-containing protein
MAKEKSPGIKVKTYATHHVITQPNPLRGVLQRVSEKDVDDPVARAEQALAGLSGEFKNWMLTEADRLTTAYAAILKNGFSPQANDELFRAAHDIKGDAATFGYPSAAAAADSLCRIIEHAPELDKVPKEIDRAPYQCDPGDRDRSYQARYGDCRERAEPQAARRRG